MMCGHCSLIELVCESRRRFVNQRVKSDDEWHRDGVSMIRAGTLSRALSSVRHSTIMPPAAVADVVVVMETEIN